MNRIFSSLKLLVSAGFLLLASLSTLAQGNPFLYQNGTGWVSDFYDVIVPGDPSAFQTIQQGSDRSVLMWDRDANNNAGAWINPLSYVYALTYDDSIVSEIRIRKVDFSQTEADELAQTYGQLMGQLPAFLRAGVDSINILASDALFGGNNWLHSIEITIGATSELYLQTGNMEEILLHEATHAALDQLYTDNSDWATAQDQDPRYVSRYAADNPNREDIAETIVPYLGIRYQNARIEQSTQQSLNSSISHRMALLDSLDLDLYPMVNATNLPTPDWAREVRIYPNPATEQVNLEIPGLKPTQLELLSAEGKLIASFEPTAQTLDVSRLPAGLYFVRIVIAEDWVNIPLQVSP